MPLSKKKLLTTKKVETSEEVDKGNKNLDDMKEAVFTIRRKDLDNFEGQSKGSTGWFNLDHEFFKRNVSTLELHFYNFSIKNILKFKIWNHIKRFY